MCYVAIPEVHSLATEFRNILKKKKVVFSRYFLPDTDIFQHYFWCLYGRYWPLTGCLCHVTTRGSTSIWPLGSAPASVPWGALWRALEESCWPSSPPTGRWWSTSRTRSIIILIIIIVISWLDLIKVSVAFRSFQRSSWSPVRTTFTSAESTSPRTLVRLTGLDFIMGWPLERAVQ